MLEIRGIKKRFGEKTAVDNLNFTLNSGEIAGLLGPNGAGKTTTIRVILGILRPDEGEVLFNTKPIGSAYLKRTGYVPEEKGLYRQSTVLENLLYFASLKGMEKAEAKERIIILNKLLPLEPILTKRVAVLSKGNQQLAQILTGVVHDPEIVLFDEPYNGLDPFVQEQFSELINYLRRRGKAILISTHLLQFAEDICNQVLLMNNARQVYWGELKTLYDREEKNGYYAKFVAPVEHHSYIAAAVKDFDHDGEQCQAVFADPDFLRECCLSGRIVSISAVEKIRMSLREIFMEMIGKSGEQDGRK